jgi:phosphopantothenoylcysteine decarboxylase/phosphopantothenate--cysteine ligase
MAEPEAIFTRIQEVLAGANGSLAGKRVIVTAGGTREPIDPVRFVGNRSSGHMGTAIAAEARRRGAEVTLIASNLSVPPPSDVEVVEAPTADDLARETLARSDSDVVVMAAAVSDYRPTETLGTKRPKDDRPWTVELEPTDDVLRALTARRPANGRIVVGFAAEAADDGLRRAREKRAVKKADLLVYNDVGRSDIGFETAENEVVIISEQGERQVARAPKERVAAEILNDVERLLERRNG